MVVAGHRLHFQARARVPLPLPHQQRRAAHRPARAIEDDVARVAIGFVSGQHVQMDVEPLVLEHGVEDLEDAHFRGQELLHSAADPLQSVVAEVLEACVADKQGVEQRHQAHDFAQVAKPGSDFEGHHCARAIPAETIGAVRLHGSKLLHVEGSQFARCRRRGLVGGLESVYPLLRSQGAGQALSDPGVAIPC